MLSFFVQHSPVFYLTQSLWRDEAYSILLAEKSVLTFFKITFDPPLYYILLHFWMKLFGESEIAVRSLSILGFALAVIVVIHWAEALFKKHWLFWFLPVFFFFNPTLIYYAFEVRAYGWYIFFAVLSFWAYMEKRWNLLIIATVLGLYTHTYMIIVPMTQFVHYILVQKKWTVFRRFATLTRDPMIRALTVSAALFAPWIIHVFLDLSKLKSSWYFPVDFQLVRSVLGNVFVEYEGTPWFLWPFTAFLSVLLIAATILSLTPDSTRRRNSFFTFMIYIPLLAVIGVSFFKPLFVNRYVIPVTIAEVFTVAFAIESIKNKTVQKVTAIVSLMFVLGFNAWFPTQHAKLDSRKTITEINGLMGKHDVILADSPLIFFESVYYSRDRSRVFWYDPQGAPFPWYVGGAIVSPRQIVTELPPYPIRAFVVHGDGTYEIAYTTNSPK